jgi:hypothetical protein
MHEPIEDAVVGTSLVLQLYLWSFDDNKIYFIKCAEKIYIREQFYSLIILLSVQKKYVKKSWFWINNKVILGWVNEDSGQDRLWTLYH